MFYVVRSTTGAVQSVSRISQPGCEALEDHHPDIQTFLTPRSVASGFSTADADFVRVIEDLIDTLIAKNVIRHTDLPAAAQAKLIQRKGLRNRVSGALNLLGEDKRIL